MGKYISGIAKESNLDKWANYAKQNSYGDNDRQGKSQLDSRDKTHEASDGPTSVRTKEGQGWVITNYCAAENSYTGKGGSMRD